MNAAPRFSLRAAVTDSVSTGRRDEAPTAVEPEPTAEPDPASAAPRRAEEHQDRAPGDAPGCARDHRVGRAGDLPHDQAGGLDADMTTQDVMMEAINDLLSKRGKGRIVKTR